MWNFNEDAISQLQHEHPGWQVWVIYKAVGGSAWCAKRHDEDTASLNASSAGELATLLAGRDLDRLRAQFPAWTIGAVNGPDWVGFTAQCGNVQITAATVARLEARLTGEEPQP